jgi:hypothetical protein
MESLSTAPCTPASMTRPATAKAPPALVFISYSHTSHTHVSRLLPHLRRIEEVLPIRFWHDAFHTGDAWHTGVQQALADAIAYLPILCPHALDSRYIRAKEYPVMLAQHAQHGKPILPVLAAPCAYKTLFGNFQPCPVIGARPVFIGGHRRPELCRDIARMQIEAALRQHLSVGRPSATESPSDAF